MDKRGKWFISVVLVLLFLQLALGQQHMTLKGLTSNDIAGLNNEQKAGVSAEQLVNCIINVQCVSNLGDLSTFPNAPAALQQQFGVTVDFGSSGNLLNGKLLTSNGNFGFDGKRGFKIRITQTGHIEILEPKKISSSAIGASDTFTLIRKTSLVDDGKTRQVEGLSFKEGVAYVKKGHLAKIDYNNDGVVDYVIPASTDVNIALDPSTPPQGNSILITATQLQIFSEPKSEVTVIPQNGNRVLLMEEWDYSTIPISRKPAEFDEMSIIVSGGDVVDITSREKDGLTPLIKHISGNGKTSIQNGRMLFNLHNGKLTAKISGAGILASFPMEGSVGFELTSDIEDDILLRTSSSNRFSILQDGVERQRNGKGVRISNKIDFNMIKTLQDIKFHFPNLPVDTIPDTANRDYKQITANMAQLLFEWLEDKPGIEKSINKITFSGGWQGAVTLEGELQLGEAAVDPASAPSSGRESDTGLETLDHEFVHLVDVRAQKMHGNYYLERYDEAAAKIIDNLYQDPDFIKLIVKLKHADLKYARHVQREIEVAFDPEVNSAVRGDAIIRIQERLQRDRSRRTQQGRDSIKLLKKFTKLIKDKTGLLPYAFQTRGIHFKELPAIYQSETSILDARKNPELAKIAYDQAHNLGIKRPENHLPDKDIWIVDKAKTKFFRIVGGRNGPYCLRENCGPEIINANVDR